MTDTMSRELVVPAPSTIIPPGFAEQARSHFQEQDDIDGVDETRRQIAALEKYVKDKASRREAESAGRWAEVRIGQLLGEPELGGRGNKVSLASDSLSVDDRYRFRLLAQYVAIVEECLRSLKTSRKAILDEIRKRTERIPLAVQPTIEHADALEWLPRQPDCELLLTDPPYSTDVSDIDAFAANWLPLALSKVKPFGRAYVCIGAYPDELRAYLAVAPPNGFVLANILVWTYRNTLGPAPTYDYKLNWQAILYYRGPEAGPLDCPQMTEQFSVQDINAPDGRHGDRWHPWQKPDELGERFVRHGSEPGDLVLDPFAGTGAFLLAAGRWGRIAAGCETNPDTLDIAVQRGCNHAR